MNEVANLSLAALGPHDRMWTSDLSEGDSTLGGLVPSGDVLAGAELLSSVLATSPRT